MRSHFVSGLVVLGLSAAGTSVGHAQTIPEPAPVAGTPAPMDTAPTAGTAASTGAQTLAAGKILITAPLVINMSTDRGGKPINIPLDVYYGINDDFTIGLSHSRGTDQVAGIYPLGAGLCLTGDTSGCGKFYNNVGIDALYAIMKDTIKLAGHGGIDFISLDPMYMTLRLGVLVKAPVADTVSLIADPRLWIGVTKRDEGNKEYLSIPLAVQMQINDAVRVAFRTVFGGPLDRFGDAYTGSLGLYGAFNINAMIEAFAAFDLLNVYGKKPGSVGAADWRQLVLGANIRL